MEVKGAFVFTFVLATVLGAFLGYGLSAITFNAEIEMLQSEIRMIRNQYQDLIATVTSMGNVLANLCNQLNMTQP